MWDPARKRGRGESSVGSNGAVQSCATTRTMILFEKATSAPLATWQPHDAVAAPPPPQRQRLSGERDRQSDYCGQSRTLLVALSTVRTVVGCVHRALFCRTAAKHGAANWDGQRNRIQRQLSQLSPRSNVCDMLGVPASCNLALILLLEESAWPGCLRRGTGAFSGD